MPTLVESCDEKEKQVLSVKLNKHLNEMLTITKESISILKSANEAPIISIEANSYDMKEYVTISQYAKLFGYKSTQAVSNKIARGTIPKDDILIIQYLDLKLIRIPIRSA